MWYIIESNKQKTNVLLTLMVFVLAILMIVFGVYFTGDISFGSIFGLCITIIFSVWIIIYVKKNSTKFFLDQVNAVPIKEKDYPVLENIVEEMSISANLGFVPKIYIVDSKTPNAFAVGINKQNSAVAVTVGLLNLLNRDELQGVIAHEISHIKNQDTLYLMYAGIIFGVIIAIADILIRSIGRSRNNKGSAPIIILALIFAILAPVAGKLLYFSVSRKREFLADACACQYTRYPTGLASALHKISNFSYNNDSENKIDTEKDFNENISKDEKIDSGKVVSCMYIHNFLQKKHKMSFLNLFDSHPPIENRIKVLKSMGAADIVEYQKTYTSIVSKKHLIPKNKLSKMDIQHLAIVTPLVTETNETSPEIKIKEKITQQRKVKNVCYSAKNYKIIDCACETKLKIPPEYQKETIRCPHCGNIHNL